MNSYLSGRKQQVKLNSIVSSWSFIKKGIPQGSILGPFFSIIIKSLDPLRAKKTFIREKLINVFINDIFYFIEHGTFYNYVDDNTIPFSCPDFDQSERLPRSGSNLPVENRFHIWSFYPDRGLKCPYMGIFRK